MRVAGQEYFICVASILYAFHPCTAVFQFFPGLIFFWVVALKVSGFEGSRVVGFLYFPRF